MSKIYNLPEATEVSDNDYVYISSSTLGDRKIKAEKFSGGDPVLITKNITQNGTYSASSDNADGYSEIDVDIKIVESITQNNYDLLSQAEKMNGNIYFIEDEGKVYYLDNEYKTT